VSCAKTAELIDLPFDCGFVWSKEAHVQSYSPGGANVPSWEGTLSPPSEYISTIRLRRRYGLMSNYFDHVHLFLFYVTFGILPTQLTERVRVAAD